MLLFLYVADLTVFAQKHDYIWLPGRGGLFQGTQGYVYGGMVMDFNQYPEVILSGKAIFYCSKFPKKIVLLRNF